MDFNKDILKLDCEAEIKRLCRFIQKRATEMKREGAVIGISGGVDSALCATLCTMALGESKVLGLLLPEKESNPISEKFATVQAKKLGIKTITDDITGTLRGFGTYEKRDSVIRELFPEYDSSYKSKIVLPPDLLAQDALNYFTLKIVDREGKEKHARLNSQTMRRIVAATDTKQVTRMMYLNYYAELTNYFVCGTTNRTEYIQGFFVKYGDGGVDIEPIEHLYKMQVYQLAARVGVIPEIIEREPSPDTFSFPVTDEEMYFRIPYHTLDLLLYGWENKISIARVAAAMDLTEQQVGRAFRDIESKYNATKNLRLPPQNIASA